MQNADAFGELGAEISASLHGAADLLGIIDVAVLPVPMASDNRKRQRAGKDR